MKSVALSIALAMLLGGAASAQDQNHPNLARGIQPEKLYNFSDVDTVNSFNGNMTLRIPIGPALSVNGALPYQLTLSYNSHAWDFASATATSDDLTQYFLDPMPAQGMNAGLGWTLMLGGMYFANGIEVDTYKTPDGGGHRMGSWVPPGPVNPDYAYCGDSSYVRLHQIDAQALEIELPNGVVQTFNNLPKRDGQWWPPGPPSTPSSDWRLTAIRDRFGNEVSVGYSSNASSNYSEIWTITKGGGPATTVYFKKESDLVGTSTWTDTLVDHITAPTVGGGTSTYTFSYIGQTLPLPNGSSPLSGGTSVRVALLTSINLPDGESYSSMTYDTTTTASGALTALTLPTGGTIQWTYAAADDFDDWSWTDRPKEAPHAIPSVVTTRSFGGGTWTYGRWAGGVSCYRPCPGGCCRYGGARQLTTWTTTPDNATTISYFSLYTKGLLSRRGSDVCSFPVGEAWLTNEYGLPFTRSIGSTVDDTTCSDFDPGPPNPSFYGGSAALTQFTDAARFLSTEVRTDFVSPTTTWGGLGRVPAANGTALRSTWLKYDLDAYDQTLARQDKNARVSASLTFFEDDPASCKPGDTSTPCKFSGANSSTFDGYGHYKQSSSLSNFGGSADFRTTFRNYATSLPGGNWILGTYSEQCTADEASQRTTAVSVCSELPAANRLTTAVQFDSSTGAVTAKRVKAATLVVGTTSDTHDLLALFEYDHGLVKREAFYGGDQTPLSTTSGFTTSSVPDYDLSHVYTFASGALQKVQTHYATAAFLTEDVDLDAATGVVTAARDVAGLTTTYDYTDPESAGHPNDPLNRLRAVKPPAEAWTEYVYTNATGATVAGVSVKQFPYGSSFSFGSPSALTDKEIYFDLWGRLRETKTLMPAGWSTIVQNVDAMGRVTSASTPEYKSGGAFEIFAPAHVVSNAYDVFGRTTSVTQPDATATTFAYNGVRQVARTVTVAESSGNQSATTTETRDLMGRLTQVQEPSGIFDALTTTSYAYDVGDRLTSVSSPPQTRTFVYDGRGFLISETHPEKGVTGNATTAYQVTDGAGNVSGYDARGHAHRRVDGSVDGAFDLTYTYDDAERLTKVEDPDPASGASPKSRRPLKVFTFATANAPAGCTDTTQTGTSACNASTGKLQTAVRHNYNDPVGGDVTVTDTWTYSGFGGHPSQRDTAVSATASFSGASFRASQTWNDLGLVSTLSYPARCIGTDCTMPDQRTVTNSYTNGLLTGVTGFANALTYQANGLLDMVTHANAVKERWIADPSGMARPCAIFAYGGTGVALISGSGGSYPACGYSVSGPNGGATTKWGSGAYGFDGAGNITAIGAKSYTYDRVSRLTTASGGETLAYDAFGNITDHTGSAGNIDSSTNRLTTATYDAAGNVTSSISGPNSQYATWDALGMIQTWRETNALLPGHALRDASFLYDADEERIAAIDRPSGDLVASLQTLTTYTLRGFDARLLRSYFDDRRALDLQPPGAETWAIKEDEIWRAGQLLALVTGEGSIFHYTLDHLGSPATITDDAGLANTPTYNPFGTGGINFGALQFTGHERDQGGGLDYMHARYYSASVGRFLSVDSVLNVKAALKHPQVWNRYAYTIDNPLKFTDPTGEEIFLVGDNVEKRRTLMLLKFMLHNREASKSLTTDKDGRLVVTGMSAADWGKKFGGDSAKLGALIDSKYKLGVGVISADIGGGGGRFDPVSTNYALIVMDERQFPKELFGRTQWIDTTMAHELYGHGAAAAGTLNADVGHIHGGKGLMYGIGSGEADGMWAENQYRSMVGLPLRQYYAVDGDYIPPGGH